MRKKNLLPICLALTLSLTACAGSAAETPTSQESSAATESEEAKETQDASDPEASDSEGSEEETETQDSEVSETETTAKAPESADSETETAAEAPKPADDTTTGSDQDASDVSDATDEPTPAEEASLSGEETDNTFSESDYAEAYAAYYRYLPDHRQAIDAYNWQNIEWTEDGPIYHPDYKVAIADVYGDETPELLYMENYDPDGQGYTSVASLNIVTFEGGEIKTLYSEVLDAEVAGGTSFCVFTVTGKKEPVVYYDIGDEGWTWTYLELTEGDGVLNAVRKAEMSEYPNEDFSEMVKTYKLDEKETDEASFAAYRQDLIDSFDRLIFYGDLTDEEMIRLMAEKGWIGMGYTDALAFLEERAVDVIYPNAEMVDTESFFSSVEATDFYFASGVGAWGTELTLHADGSFEGSFHDSDMGDTGDGYPNGTVYISQFSGQFDHVRKIDEYTYLLSLTELICEDAPEGERIEDEIRYVFESPYGLDTGKVYLFYLPGKPLAEMDEEAVNWYTMPRSIHEDDRPDTLPCYGFYSPAAETAFFS